MEPIRKVVVLGANGTMGSGAGGLFAANGFEVVMLARSLDKAWSGLARAKEAARSDVLGQRMRCGSYDEDLEREVAAADLVFEAVSEDLVVKATFLERIDQARRKGSVVATVSSGLSLAGMAAGRSDDFRRHFLGMHLFNPPHVITGTELIAGPETDRELVQVIGKLLRRRLGRTVVECRDRPAFLGNRIGFKVLNECAILAEAHGVGLIDYLIGPYTGRALAPLATIDLVGWDVHQAIVDNVYAHTHDEAHDRFEMPAYMKELLADGHLGDKTPLEGGFYRRWTEDGQRIVSRLKPHTRQYSERDAAPVAKLLWVEEIKRLHAVGQYGEAMRKLLGAEGEEADLVRRVLLGYVSYALSRVGPDEVVDSPVGVDEIMGFGFNWAPPSVLVDLWGKRDTLAWLDRLELRTPPVLAAWPDGKRMYAQPSATIGRFFYGK